MSKTITRLFDNITDAKSSVSELESICIPHTDISIVGSSPEPGWTGRKDMTGHEIAGHNSMTEAPAAGGVVSAHDAGKDAGTGAKLGGVVGGGAGLLAGLGMLAIPGIGPVVAGGWLISTVVGAVVGAAAGGAAGSLVGSLIQAGVSENDAHVYAEGVRRGGALVSARVDEQRQAEAEAALQRFRGVDAETRGADYRASGWASFDPEASARTDDRPSEQREPMFVRR